MIQYYQLIKRLRKGARILKFTEFKNAVENGEDFSIVLAVGEDAFFRERAVTLLKNKFVTEPTINAATFDGGSFSMQDLLSSLSAYPFMSEKRLTLIREFYPKAETLKKDLKSYLENPPQGSLFLIVNEKPCEVLSKFKTVTQVECGKADLSVIVRWIKGRAGEDGVTIDGETAGLIAEFCQSDMTRVKCETEKLIAYLGNGGVITRELVEENVNKSAEYKIYEMTDCIAKKKFDKAMEIITDMLGKGEPPQKLLVSTYNYFRKLLMVAISDLPPAALGNLLGMKEYAVKKTKEQAAMFKMRALKRAVDELSDADYYIKSGRGEADELMWLTIFKIMTEA